MYALVDCNNFYASCERLFQPKLENRPVVVLSNNDGCTIARSDEAKAIGIEMGARRNPDADAVRLELLGARKTRHRQLGLGQRQRGEIGIGAHVGDDAGDDRGLARRTARVRVLLGSLHG